MTAKKGNLSLVYESPDSDEPKLEILFVHGIDGDWRDTWRHPDLGEDDIGWPIWLGEDLAQAGVSCRVHSIDYPATTLKGNSLPMFDQAEHILEVLDLKMASQTPIFFICHSLGGILVKRMLDLARSKSGTKAELPKRTKAILFLGTPNDGAAIAGLVGKIPWIGTATLEDLERANPQLRESNAVFRDQAGKLEWFVFQFAEGQKTGKWKAKTKVVDQFSADSGVGEVVTCVSEDHISLPKPARDGIVYMRAQRIAQSLRTSAKKGRAEVSTNLGNKTMSPSYDFFISYTQKDAQVHELARNLASELEERGKSVFIDTRGIPSGAKWGEIIGHALNHCDNFIVLLSDISITRDMIIEEVRIVYHRFKETGKPQIFPFKVGLTAELPYPLGAWLNPLQQENADHLNSSRVVELLLSDEIRPSRKNETEPTVAQKTVVLGGQGSDLSQAGDEATVDDAEAAGPAKVRDLAVYSRIFKDLNRLVTKDTRLREFVLENTNDLLLGQAEAIGLNPIMNSPGYCPSDHLISLVEGLEELLANEISELASLRVFAAGVAVFGVCPVWLADARENMEIEILEFPSVAEEFDLGAGHTASVLPLLSTALVERICSLDDLFDLNGLQRIVRFPAVSAGTNEDDILHGLRGHLIRKILGEGTKVDFDNKEAVKRRYRRVLKTLDRERRKRNPFAGTGVELGELKELLKGKLELKDLLLLIPNTDGELDDILQDSSMILDQLKTIHDLLPPPA